MSVDLKGTALFEYLKRKDGVYAGKVVELREAVEKWLEYIPETFPHYTRHTVGHSDEIVSQLSKLLFRDEGGRRPVVRLSAAEAYILAACAYLHDAGMVVSDTAKAEILSSDAWKEWTTAGGGGEARWRKVVELRQKAKPSDADLHFAADLQTRFLIAEFIRRTHHLRVADVITQHQARLGRFAFDDPMLQRTIANVCVAHGLRLDELEDRERYPDTRDIRGDPVNVRLMAILVRLGDLLDMSSDRACPLLLSAACPLPADSLAHWAQYERITHRMTSSNRIEVRGECQTQEEHRTLRDWCQWLVDEVEEARKLMATAERHADWKPPRAALDGLQPTMVVRPAPGATYVPLDWRFELDTEAVLERLIHDVHDRPETFIRELIQNALDASRCQMYADLKAEGITPPEYPTEVEEDRRQRYPVRITLRTQGMRNELSSETEERQILTVEDCGIGMDKDIIQRYLLQVGRTYYDTQEFRRTFGFVPTSRFGVGFLSVFAVSDHITVETYKPTSPAGDGALRLTLTGPRNYLLTDRAERRTTGTAVRVVLRELMQLGKLTELVRGWCRRVEFPVIVDDLGEQTTVQAERPEDFTFEVPDVEEPGAAFVMRALPVCERGIEGQIYLLARRDEQGEDWAVSSSDLNTYAARHPYVAVPSLPGDLVCLHGISVHAEKSAWFAAPTARVDLRSPTHRTPLHRGSAGPWDAPLADQLLGPQVGAPLERALSAHLAESTRANSQDGWRYKQILIGRFDFNWLQSFWASQPRTIRTYRLGRPALESFDEVERLEAFTVVCARWRTAAQDNAPLAEIQGACLTEEDIEVLSGRHRRGLFEDRSVVSVRWLSSGHLAVEWERGSANEVFSAPDPHGLDQTCQFLMLPDPGVVAVEIHPAAAYRSQRVVLLNTAHPLVDWLRRMREWSAAARHSRHGRRVGSLVGLLASAAHNLEHLGLITHFEHATEFGARLKGWRDFPGLPADLRPPDIELTTEMFLLRPPSRT